MDVNEVLEMTETLASKPRQCRQVRLADCPPDDRGWTEAAVDFLRELAPDNLLLDLIVVDPEVKILTKLA